MTSHRKAEGVEEEEEKEEEAGERKAFRGCLTSAGHCKGEFGVEKFQ